MNSLADVLKQSKIVSEQTETCPGDVVLKLAEEVGEISAEWLRIKGIKPIKGKLDPEKQIRLECGDALLTLLDLMHNRLNMSEEDMVKVITPGLSKWKSQVFAKQSVTFDL